MPKTKTLTGYLINPYANTVAQVTLGTDYKEIYPLIDCTTFDIARVESNGDGIFVDDEGLLVITSATRFFKYEGYHSPLAGKGLMLGVDGAGNSINPKTVLAIVQSKVKFYSLDEVRRML